MFINEYGSKDDPIMLLLAPMMVSGEDLYQLMHPYFQEHYHFISPDQGGHGKAGAYTIADEECFACTERWQPHLMRLPPGSF